MQRLEISFALPLDLHAALVRLALYVALVALGAVALIMGLVFVVNLAIQILITACQWANHLDILTQVLLILVLGFLLLKIVTLTSRGLRVMCQK